MNPFFSLINLGITMLHSTIFMESKLDVHFHHSSQTCAACSHSSSVGSLLAKNVSTVVTFCQSSLILFLISGLFSIGGNSACACHFVLNLFEHRKQENFLSSEWDFRWRAKFFFGTNFPQVLQSSLSILKLHNDLMYGMKTSQIYVFICT